MKRSFLVSLTTLILAGLILVSCGSSPSPSSYSRPASVQVPPKWANVVLTGENEPLLEGTTWILANDAEGWNTTWEFRASGRVVFRTKSPNLGAYTIDQTNTFMWGREGDFVRIIGSGGQWLREGKYYPQTQNIMLTFEGSDGKTFEETLVPLQRSSIASAPSSTTNVYVQPSVPAQNPAPAPAPSTPTFQPGRYAFSGSNITMSLSGYQAAAYSGYEQVAWGTYRINGNQLVITFNTGIGAGAILQGKTFAYTITSNTSFSGSGETWVRTGY